jgi:hypothetical protein
MIYRNIPELLQTKSNLQNKITNLNIEIKNAYDKIAHVTEKTNEILHNINELTGLDFDKLAQKSDLENLLSKDDILSISGNPVNNKLLTKNNILNIFLLLESNMKEELCTNVQDSQ